jgi:hypothetical protein
VWMVERFMGIPFDAFICDLYKTERVVFESAWGKCTS